MLKAELLRYVKNPINIIMSFLFPIVLLVIYGLVQMQQLNLMMSSVMFLNTLSITIIPISINFFLDKFDKRIKHYLIIDHAFLKYIGSSLLINLVIYFLNLVVIIIVAITAFNLQLSPESWITLILTAPILFVLGFMIGTIIGSFAKSFAWAMSISMITFYSLIVLSGLTFPFHFIMDGYYYLEMLTPWGQIQMLFINNEVPQALNLATWQVALTSILFLGSISLITGLFIYSLKNFRK